MLALAAPRLSNMIDSSTMTLKPMLLIPFSSRLEESTMNIRILSLLEPTYSYLTWGIIFVIALFPFLSYLVTWRSFTLQRLGKEHTMVPPIVPYALPLIGSAVSFVLNPAKCISETTLVLTYLLPPDWPAKLMCCLGNLLARELPGVLRC